MGFHFFVFSPLYWHKQLTGWKKVLAFFSTLQIDTLVLLFIFYLLFSLERKWTTLTEEQNARYVATIRCVNISWGFFVILQQNKHPFFCLIHYQNTLYNTVKRHTLTKRHIYINFPTSEHTFIPTGAMGNSSESAR